MDNGKIKIITDHDENGQGMDDFATNKFAMKVATYVFELMASQTAEILHAIGNLKVIPGIIRWTCDAFK